MDENKDILPEESEDIPQQDQTQEFIPPTLENTSSEEAFLPLQEEAEKKSNNNKIHWIWGISSLILILLACFAVYSFQKNKTESKEDEAFKQGEKQGQIKVQARYDKGGAGYNQILEAGKKIGITEGSNNEKEEGIAEGRKIALEELKQTSPIELDPAPGASAPPKNSVAARKGAAFAWGGFSDWSDTLIYGLKFGEGEGAVPYQIVARMTFEPNKLYRICADKPSLLCEVNIPRENTVPGKTETPGGVTDTQTDNSTSNKKKPSDDNQTSSKKNDQVDIPELPLDPTDDTVRP